MSDFRFSLDTIEVPIPCTVPWESMRGSDRVRHCGQCRQNVYELSSMSKEETQDLIRRKEGKLCVRFFRRPDGRVVTRDCGVVRWSRAAWSSAAFVVLGLLSIFTAIFVPWIHEEYDAWEKRKQGRWLQGAICPETTASKPPVAKVETAPPPREVPNP